MTKRLTVVYEVPDDYNVIRITGTGELEVVRCGQMDVMLELGTLTARLAEAEARLRKYEPEPGKCEHGVTEGDWCEPCNKAYKEAAEEAANGGRDE